MICLYHNLTNFNWQCLIWLKRLAVLENRWHLTCLTDPKISSFFLFQNSWSTNIGTEPRACFAHSWKHRNKVRTSVLNVNPSLTIVKQNLCERCSFLLKSYKLNRTIINSSVWICTQLNAIYYTRENLALRETTLLLLLAASFLLTCLIFSCT